MTATQAVHLIEQFAAQAPFAVWITDSRGITIFANRKLHELFGIPEHPSGALGFNLFEDPAVGALGLGGLMEKARAGEVVDAIVDIPRPATLDTRVKLTRDEPLVVRVNIYPLRSSAQKIEHYVFLHTDITEMTRQREELKGRLRDLSIYNASREARLSRVHELEAEIEALEKEILARGAKPAP
ncbi:MAG TPA: PAS domain-containing protein [Patescibacteria group bacterium]|nr:PAS domain-containing protein [Patescibacteria group bacterium]